MTLYDQLMYNWERGFYSVIQDKWDDYYVVSAKSWNHGFFVTEPHLTVIAAKARVGDSKEYSGDLINTLVNPVNGGWKILENETFHPSELMGKGFQVGDRVEILDHFDKTGYKGRRGEVCMVGNYAILVMFDASSDDKCYFDKSDLKPVVPGKDSECDCTIGYATDSGGNYPFNQSEVTEGYPYKYMGVHHFKYCPECSKKLPFRNKNGQIINLS